MINKILNSKVYQVFDFICRLLVLNVLIILCSFSIFIVVTTIWDNLPNWAMLLLLIPTALTLVPCIVAATDVIKSYLVDKNTGLFKDFFRAFKKYYFKSVLLSIIVVVAAILLLNSYSYFDSYKLSAPIYMIGYILTLSFSVIFIFAFIHVPLNMIYFTDLNIIQYIKLALIFGFKDLGKSLILLVIAILSIVISYFIQIYLLLFSFSLVIFFVVLLTKKSYLKVVNKLDNEGEKNEKNN